MGRAMQENGKAQQLCQGDSRSQGCRVPIEAATGATANTLAIQSLQRPAVLLPWQALWMQADKEQLSYWET